MISEDKEDNKGEITKDVTDDALEFLDGLVNVSSMEEKYRAAGTEMKNTKLLAKLLNWMSKR